MVMYIYYHLLINLYFDSLRFIIYIIGSYPEIYYSRARFYTLKIYDKVNTAIGFYKIFITYPHIHSPAKSRTLVNIAIRVHINKYQIVRQFKPIFREAGKGGGRLHGDPVLPS